MNTRWSTISLSTLSLLPFGLYVSYSTYHLSYKVGSYRLATRLPYLLYPTDQPGNYLTRRTLDRLSAKWFYQAEYRVIPRGSSIIRKLYMLQGNILTLSVLPRPLPYRPFVSYRFGISPICRPVRPRHWRIWYQMITPRGATYIWGSGQSVSILPLSLLTYHPYGVDTRQAEYEAILKPQDAHHAAREVYYLLYTVGHPGNALCSAYLGGGARSGFSQLDTAGYLAGEFPYGGYTC